MPRIPFVAGNWKMNTTKATATALARGVAQGAPAPSKVQVGVAPPFVYLDAVGQAIAGSAVLLGAQDCYFEKSGAFTGEISVEMLKDLGVRFCLAGHSERRHVLKEPAELVAKKAAAIYNGGLVLIHCVGEKLEERQANRTFDVIRRQVEELTPEMNDAQRVVIAYEPVWAIGTGKTPTTPEVAAAHAHIRKVLGGLMTEAGSVRLLYGGSVKGSNAAELLAAGDVDGALVGGASLKADEFLAIAKAV
jgi:triosephosphate isomerase (TIM)